MKEALRRIVGLVVSLVGVGAITLLSSAILAVLWMALIWGGHFAAMVLPAWLVSTARYAVWGFALMFMASLAPIVVLSYGHDVLLWAYRAVGIQKSEKAPAPPPSDSGNGQPAGV